MVNLRRHNFVAIVMIPSVFMCIIFAVYTSPYTLAKCLHLQPRSSAIAEGPRDASCQLKCCQLPRCSADTTCTTSPEQIEVMKLEG